MLLASVIVVVLAIVGAAGAVAAWLSTPRRTAVRRRVLVNLVDGKAIAGVLWARRGPLLVLKDATLHGPGPEPVPVDGEVLVERGRVDFVQVLQR